MENTNEVPSSFYQFKAPLSETDAQDKAFAEVEPCTDHQLLQALADGELIVSEGPVKTVEEYEADKWDSGRERKGLIEHLRAVASRRR